MKKVWQTIKNELGVLTLAAAKNNCLQVERIYQKMGYELDQEGIMRRYINEEGNWDAHLNRTKEFICKCVSIKKPSSIAILGSGWLLDVPIEFLSENCSSVFLYDIRHPMQVKHKFRKLKNIHFRTIDITNGAVESVYEIMKKPQFAADKLRDLQINRLQLSEPVDFIVSVNLLCQLDVLIIEYLRNFSMHLSDEDLKNLRKKIQEQHLFFVSGNKACLIADFQELVYDRAGNLQKTNTHLFANLPEYSFAEEWIWNFDTQMTYYPNHKTNLSVKAIQF